LTYPKSTMRVRRMPMHLSSGHVTLMPGKFYPPPNFPQSDSGRRADSCWALPQISSLCLGYEPVWDRQTEGRWHDAGRGVEVIIDNFWPKICNMLLKIEDREQHLTNWGEKFSIMIETPVSICFLILQRIYVKFVVFYVLFEQGKHGCLLITYDVPFSHNARRGHRRLEC